MIYLGLINYSGEPDALGSTLESYTDSCPKKFTLNPLTLFYGKLSQQQDLDEIWENENSVFIGRVFDREHQCLLQKESFNSLSTSGKGNIFEKVWGRYVYINRDKNNSKFEITLDATGQLPFFYYVFENGNMLFSSHIEVIYKFLGQKPEYNWDYIYSYLIFGNSSSCETPFKNVYELPPACCLQVSSTKRKTLPAWNPLQTNKMPGAQNKDAVSILQETLKPWIDPYEKIWVSLSGGLDSSSIVYSLKGIVRKDQELKALNYFHSQVQSSNELLHARKVCRESGIELTEIDTSDCLPFTPTHWGQTLRPNKPYPGLPSLRWLEKIKQHIHCNNSMTFIDGQGSDHIFMRPPPKTSIADFVLEKGLRGSKKKLDAIAHMYRDPVFSLTKTNLTSLLAYYLGKRQDKRSLGDTDQPVPDWFDIEAVDNAAKAYIHPIYEHLPQKVLPGKYEQFDAFFEALSSIHCELISPCNPTFSPFLYQPVVEFAFSFPTYELYENKYDRYPLRKAIWEHFQADVAWRRDKSETTGLFQLGVKQNLSSILDLCLEGHLAKQSMIHREGLRNTLNLIAHGDAKDIWPFIRLVSIEMFLDYWGEVA